jgi:ribose 5-phosphate isomerase A
MLLGLGTGSTAALFIEALAGCVATGLKVRCVATSRASHELAAQLGLDVIAFDDLAKVDLAIDGADEVDPQLRAIKGAGGALLREKIVARAATKMICIVDPTKLVARIGKAPVPVEVLPFARSFVSRNIEMLRGNATARDGVTDQGNVILDCWFKTLDDPALLDRQLAGIPGLLGHGLFLTEIDQLFVGDPDGVEKFERP